MRRLTQVPTSYRPPVETAAADPLSPSGAGRAFGTRRALWYALVYCWSAVRKVRDTTLAGHVLIVLACGHTSDESHGSQGGPDCVHVPDRVSASADRSVSGEAATAGCREFGDAGCLECCLPRRTPNDAEDCLVLNARGETLTGTGCDPSCEPCARCSLDEEALLREFPEDNGCDCSIPRDTPGFDPAVPCERYCYEVEVAVGSCPHLVCLE